MASRIEKLNNEFSKWVADNSMSAFISAEELLQDGFNTQGRAMDDKQREYLTDFIERWEAADDIDSEMQEVQKLYRKAQLAIKDIEEIIEGVFPERMAHANAYNTFQTLSSPNPHDSTLLKLINELAGDV